MKYKVWMDFIIIVIFILIVGVGLYGLSVSDILFESEVFPNITYHNWTLNSTGCSYHYQNETFGLYSNGHGDGICTHSAFYCDACNCSAKIERWCDNETEELERIREKYGDEY